MDNDIELQCDLTDLDRNGALPMSTLLVWAQKCRVGLYANSPLVAQLRREVGVLMVKHQTFEVKSPAVRLDSRVKVVQRVVGMGNSSFTLGVDFVDGEGEVWGTGRIVMVCVRDGKSQAIPQWYKDRIVVVVGGSLSELPALEETITGRVELEVKLRASDEDTNRHVKHVRYCHFMEDCVDEAGAGRVASASLTYLKECRKGETCRLVLEHGASRGRFEMRNQADQVVCTALLNFSS